jgi:ATP-binding cassette subfamily E protein 1
MRVAVFDIERCKPNDCALGPNKPCIKHCPRNLSGDETIVLLPNGFPKLNPSLCSGEGICVKKCPFGCYTIVNLPDILDKELTHKYRDDGFGLYRMLIPRPGRVLGVIGQNGIGKTTALKILSGELKMNMGKFGDDVPDSKTVIDHFKGTELQGYLIALENKQFKIVHKPQEITSIPKFVKGKVRELLGKIAGEEKLMEISEIMGLKKILDRDVPVLSGGELQRVAIAAALLKDGDVYLFDEPSSYLDVKERLNMARQIQSLGNTGKRVIVIEHDLAILDFISDYIHLLYGQPGAFGIISNPQGTRVGINIYLNGFIKDENMKIREDKIIFHDRPPTDSFFSKTNVLFEFPDMKKKLGEFNLQIYGGEIHQGEVIGILGPNGIGKTTFINLIAGKIQPDEGELPKKELKVSFKPQYISFDNTDDVDSILMKIKTSGDFDSQYKKRLILGFNLDRLSGKTIRELSGGELQRLAIADCLTNVADIYLLDEPSAFLDVEMRLAMALIIRRSIESIKKAAFVAEHDIIAQDFISDSLIVFDGEPGVSGHSTPPQDLRSGMNEFLKIMNITFRRDLSTGRPRVNKPGSNLDRTQRASNEFYYIPTGPDED